MRSFWRRLFRHRAVEKTARRAHTAAMSARMNEHDQNYIFNELPCLSGGCLRWQADEIRARIGRVYLDVEAGRTPQVPTRAELMRHCCRSEYRPAQSTTIITDGLHFERT
jgi:hypothetical protein